MTTFRNSALLLAAGAVGALSAACTDTSASGETIEVESSATSCTLSAGTAPAGRLSFSVKNSGSAVTEFYLLAKEDNKVIGEVENIGPGLSQKMTVEVSAGSYVAACKPGQAGDGIRSDFVVTG